LDNRVRGVLALTLTSVLWGSSFPVIKTVIANVNEYSYTWVRSLIAVTGLAPYLIYAYRREGISVSTVRGGLLAGLAYALGLWLQGWGTRYTTASNSAFITGLSVIYVHIYVGITARRYSLKLGLALTLSIAGLYMLTVPSTGFGVGDFLVLLGSFMWASQIILVSRYSHGNPLIFTFFEMIPALMFILPDIIDYGIEFIDFKYLLLITYLALVCSDSAFALQVLGQRYVSSAVAAIVFLLEPVSASLLSYILIGELMNSLQIIGASLILIAMLIACMDKDITSRV